MSIAGVTRELLVRYLDTWTPTALHRGRRATCVLASPDPGVPEAALRVFAEFADRLRGHRLTVVAITPHDAAGQLAAVQAELGTPPELTVHPVAGAPAALLPVTLRAAGAAGAPLLVAVETAADNDIDTDAAAAATAAATGRPGELLLLTGGGGHSGGWTGRRAGLHAAGFTLTSGVELVEEGQARLLAFATSSTKSLEAFKDCLWAVDEYAGVRYRDPGDPQAHLLDISLRPHPGPLRRELLAHLATAGESTVTDLRRFTLAETVYRSSDAVRVLGTLVASGAVTRRPPGGRLSGDVLIAPATG